MGQRSLGTSKQADYRVYAALAGLAAFTVYLRTLAPTVMWYDMGELTTASYVLGIAHNTGYPLYILLGKLFTFLPFGDVAYRMNLMSAVFAALTVSLVFVIINDLTNSILASLFGSLTLAFSSTLWSTATWAESYPLNAFFTAAVTLLLLRWRASGHPRPLYLASLLFGLAFGNHRLILLLVPGILLFLWAGRRTLNAGRCLRCGGLLLLGLSVYLYLPIRGAQEPSLNWAQPGNLDTYLSMFFTGSSRGEYWSFAIFDHLDVIGVFPLSEFTAPGLALAAIGLIYAWRRQRLFAVYGLLLCLLVAFVALSYNIHNIYNYFIPAYLVLAVWMGCAVRALFSVGVQILEVRRPQWAHSGQYLFSPAAGLLLLALPLWLLAHNLPRLDRSGDYGAHDFALTTLARVKPHATIITDSWSASPLWYAQLVEGYRRDVLVSPIFSVPGEDVPTFVQKQFDAGRPVYVAEGLRGDLAELRSRYYVQPVLLDSIEEMLSNVLPKPAYKDDLVPKGSLYRVLEEMPSLTVDDVPAAARLAVPFSDTLTLVGFQAEPQPGVRGDVLRLDYYWRLSAKTDPNLQATVFFTDESGLLDSRRGFPLWWQNWQLGGGILPASRWAPGEIIHEQYFVLVPRGIRAGTYNVLMKVQEGPLAPSTEAATGTGDAHVVGGVNVE
jgi:hypothetical protein